MEFISQSIITPKLLKEEILYVVRNDIASKQSYMGIGWHYMYVFWDLTTSKIKEKDITYHDLNPFMKGALF